MKSISDLNALIPTIVEQFSNIDHEVGESYYIEDEDGCGKCYSPCENGYSYDEGGWLIEVSYSCCGDWDGSELESASGEITEISVIYHDDDTEEETIFSEEDSKELINALNKVLERIA